MLQEQGITIPESPAARRGPAALGRAFLPLRSPAAADAHRTGPGPPIPASGQQVAQLHRQAGRQGTISGTRTPIAIVKVPRVLPCVIRLPANLRAAAALCPAVQRHPGPPGRAVPPGRASSPLAVPASRATRTSMSTKTMSPTCARRRRLLSTRNYGQAIRSKGRFLPHRAVRLPAGAVRPAPSRPSTGSTARSTWCGSTRSSTKSRGPVGTRPREGGEPHPPVKDESLIDPHRPRRRAAAPPFQISTRCCSFSARRSRTPMSTIKQTIYRTGADSGADGAVRRPSAGARK